MKKLYKEILEIIVVIVIAIIFRSVGYELWEIPSGSMIPTLLEGDRVIISKFEYGFSNSSFPMTPDLFKGRILEYNQPQRGDIIVFEHESDGRYSSFLSPLKKLLGIQDYTQYVKRLIGLPGDKVQYVDGRLYINDQLIPRVRIADFDLDGLMLTQYRETLPNGVSYNILDYDNTPYDNTIAFHVPENHYFFMGDNRDNSKDSRATDGFGYIPADRLLGKVKVVLFSKPIKDWNILEWIKDIRYDRTFKVVHKQ